MRRIIVLALAGVLTVGLAVPAAEAHHHVAGVAIASTVGFVLAAPFLIAGAILAPLIPHPPVYQYAPAPVVAPQAAYSAPAYAPRAYGAPAYGAPGYPPPAYGTPTYAPQAYGAPAYAPPAGGAPAYAAPAYAPPPPVARAPRVAPPPGPGRSYANSVEYPHGRYELRGDGAGTPYRWVWIPNAPPPPSGDPRWASR